MKRDRVEDEKITGASRTKTAFFQSIPDLTVQRWVQENRRDINDFPDFIQYFLRMNAGVFISQYIPEVIGDEPLSIFDSRKLVHPVQYGWDIRGRPYVCLTLNDHVNESGVLTLHRKSENHWCYCKCKLNCLFSPFEFDENNSKFGDFLTNPDTPFQEKVRAVGQLFQNYPERLPGPDF